MVLSRLTKITGPGIKTDTNWIGNNALFTGVTTFTNFTSSVFDADIINTKSLVGTGLSVVGVVTATRFEGPFTNLNVTGVATFAGDVSIGGTLTYEDVTNIDSVGIITARSGIDADDFISVGSNIHLGNAGVITATSFVGDGSGLIGVASTDNIVTGTAATFNTYPVDINAGMTIAGVSTFSGDVSIADKIIHTGDTNTAIRFPAADTITAETGGNERLRIDSQGRLTVGATGQTSNGIAEFHRDIGGGAEGCHILVKNTSTNSVNNTARLKLETSGGTAQFYAFATGVTELRSRVGGTADWKIRADGASNTRFFTNGNERLFINSSGHVVPGADSTYDLGLTGTRFRNVYADTLYGDGSNLTGITQTTLNNNANNRIITGSGTANTLEAEATLTYDGTSIFELQPSSATPARFIGDANRTGQGQHLAQFEGNWNGTLVGRMVVVTGEDTSNKDDGHLDFFTTPSGGSHTRRLRIDSSGNIGEGTATPSTPDGSNADNPNNGRVFTIYGDSPAINLIHNTAGGGSAGSTDYAAINFGRNGSSSNPYRAVIGYKQVEDILHINANNHIVFDTGGNINSGERLRIESDGDIGLGTNNPNRSGYGSPVVSIGYNTSNNYSVLELQGNKTSDATIATIVGYNVGGSSRIAEISMGRDSDNNSGVISFLTYDGGSGNERTRIDHDGRLLHGNASNTGVAGHGVRIQSDAVGSNYATGALALRGTGGDFYAITMLGDSGNAWGMLPIFSAGTDYLSFGYYDGPNSSNSGALFRIEEGGNVIATGSIDSASDIKLKTNIKKIDNALDKVLKLRGAEYDRIDKDNKHEIGVIAQEVEKIIPELVNTSEDPDGGETKTVSYGNMVAVLIEAIKEQNEVINKMKKEIEDLKG